MTSGRHRQRDSVANGMNQSIGRLPLADFPPPVPVLEARVQRMVRGAILQQPPRDVLHLLRCQQREPLVDRRDRVVPVARLGCAAVAET